MILNKENYHSKEANEFYFSNSQYGDFVKCEAMAMAKIRGEYIAPSNEAYSLGSYIHAWNEGQEAMDEFIAHTPELFRQDGRLYAKYEVAYRMIAVLREDPLIQIALQGDKEVIITTDMFGAPWKIKMDVLNREKGRFTDIKTVKAIHEKVWHKKYGYTNFVEAYEYVRQMAIYANVEKVHAGRDEWLEALIVAVSKEDDPDKAVITFDEESLQRELEEVEQNMPRFIAIKKGWEKPNRCERCKYCRQTKKLTKTIHFMDLLEAI